MSSLQDLKDFMNRLVTSVNNNEDLQKTVAEWLGPHMGKVLQIETEGEAFHIIVIPTKMKIKEGSYPSPDVIYRAKTAKILMDVFSGQVDFRSVTKSWDLHVIGAGHESTSLSELIMQVFMST